jgi:SAM-dependent methyltransferase
MIIAIFLNSLYLILILLMVIGCASIVFSVLSFAPWVPSRRRDLKRVFRLADLKPGQIFYDLGAGDGRVVAYAGSHFNAQAIGLEISLPLYLICRLRQAFTPGIKFKLSNLFKENLSSADVVYLFGLPATVNGQLVEKLNKELKPGAKVISYAFKMNNWTPKIIDRPTVKDLPIFLYIA